LYFPVANANIDEAIMIDRTHMTIAMYLRDAGIGAAGTTPGTHLNPLRTGTAFSFSEDLARAVSRNPSGSSDNASGLTIADYRKQSVGHAETSRLDDAAIRNRWCSAQNANAADISNRPSVMDPVASTAKDAQSDPEAGNGTGANTEQQISEGIEKAAKKYHLSEKLIKSVIRTESNFKPDAVSPAGAQGLMQLMPSTARELGVNDPFDIQQNIDGGAAYLRRMLDRFGQNLRLALAAYNAGPGTVEKYNGAVPFRETREYVDRVLKGVAV
jgi:soluble lytic murein transglycosylase-like protein